MQPYFKNVKDFHNRRKVAIVFYAMMTESDSYVVGAVEKSFQGTNSCGYDVSAMLILKSNTSFTGLLLQKGSSSASNKLPLVSHK